MKEEYRKLLAGATKQSVSEHVDHWKLSTKPLEGFDTFPEEWLDEMKSLKLRMANLKMNIHSFSKRSGN